MPPHRGEYLNSDSVDGLVLSGGDVVETLADRDDTSTGQALRADRVLGLEMGVGFPDLSCHWLIFYSVDMFSYC